LSATVEVLANDFVESGKNGGDVINGYSILVAEQTELDKCAKDPLCLNNNEIAYIPNWVSQSHKDKFDKFLTKKGYK
jgi:hypothetical protein